MHCSRAVARSKRVEGEYSFVVGCNSVNASDKICPPPPASQFQWLFAVQLMTYVILKHLFFIRSMVCLSTVGDDCSSIFLSCNNFLGYH